MRRARSARRSAGSESQAGLYLSAHPVCVLMKFAWMKERGVRARPAGTSPSFFCRASRSARMASQPFARYIASYFAMASSGAPSGKWAALKARYRNQGLPEVPAPGP